ncbi:ATP synthase F1 subunit delta [Lacticaseibacillus zhaodongensis]|uniref:ATP synthase F1 subunit delta n=1 Tax=Lacticaseibacillus zhaodongensis TaxID=2668065 RepID=UPI0012D334CE|nr:ATP synthase F1 subunit delta [Lacticaseibacillus zhaodongensis]
MALTNAIVAPRYGAALFALASEQGQVDSVHEELQQLEAVINDQPQLLAALSAPELTPETKQSFVDILKKDASQITQNLIQMVFDYGRIAALPAIIDNYEQQMRQDAGLVTGTVTTAVPMSNEQAAKLSAAIATKIGAKKAELKQNVDTSIIGGVRVEAANLVIDGTVRSRINKIRATLLAH